MSDSVQPYGQQPTRLLCPRDSLGKNTGVGSHFLLQCMHVFKEASVMSNSVQPYGQQPTRLLCPWDSLGKNTGVGCHFLLSCQAHLVSKDKTRRKYVTYSFFFNVNNSIWPG